MICIPLSGLFPLEAGIGVVTGQENLPAIVECSRSPLAVLYEEGEKAVEDEGES